MDWLQSSLISAALFAVAGLLDKFLLSSYAEDSKVYISCQVLIQQAFTIPILAVANIKFIYPISLFAIALGALQVLPSIYYMRAMQTEEVSRVISLEYLYVIFVFIGASVLLDEGLTLRSYIGGSLLILSTAIMSYRHVENGSQSRISPAIKQFCPYWILTALYYISLKYFIPSIDELQLYTWSSLGNLLAIVPLMANKEARQEATNFLGKGMVALGILLLEEAFHFLGTLSSISAYASGSVSLVTTVGALQPFITLISVIALHQIAPKALDEDLDSKTLIHKFLSLILLCLGINFIY